MAEQAPHLTRKTHRRGWVIFALAILAGALLLRHFMQRVVPVRWARAQMGQLISTQSTNGKVEPINNFAAYSPKPGTVKAVYVHEGQLVPAGKLLLSLDDSEARSDLAAALAAERGAEAALQALRQGGTRPEQITMAGDLANAKAERNLAAANLAMLRQLQKQGAASASEVNAAQSALAADDAKLKVLEQHATQNYAPLDLEHAEANVANAKAAYQSALDVLKKEDVHAPFAGTVYSVLVHPSDFVQAGDKLLQMADLRHIQVRAYFDEPEIGDLAVGKPVRIVWEARPGRVWHGRVVRTPTTIVSYGTRNVGEALISVDDSDGTLLPNTNVTLTVTIMDVRDALIIPREALRADDRGDYVFRIVNDRLARTPVKIGALNLTQVQILSGLREGDLVALSAIDGSSLRTDLAVHRVQ